MNHDITSQDIPQKLLKSQGSSHSIIGVATLVQKTGKVTTAPNSTQTWKHFA